MSKTKIVIAGLVVGYVLLPLVLVVLAVVVAIPGLASLIRGIKAVGLPLQLFTVLTNYTPMFLTAFVVGWIAYRFLGGFKVRLFIALASPWLLVNGYGCMEIADDSLLDCWNYSDPVAFVLGVSLVPLGLLVAALAYRPPSIDRSADADARAGRPAAPVASFWRRSFLR
jgi:hypothetical protein